MRSCRWQNHSPSLAHHIPPSPSPKRGECHGAAVRHGPHVWKSVPGPRTTRRCGRRVCPRWPAPWRGLHDRQGRPPAGHGGGTGARLRAAPPRPPESQAGWGGGWAWMGLGGGGVLGPKQRLHPAPFDGQSAVPKFFPILNGANTLDIPK